MLCLISELKGTSFDLCLATHTHTAPWNTSQRRSVMMGSQKEWKEILTLTRSPHSRRLCVTRRHGSSLKNTNQSVKLPTKQIILWHIPENSEHFCEMLQTAQPTLSHTNHSVKTFLATQTRLWNTPENKNWSVPHRPCCNTKQTCPLFIWRCFCFFLYLHRNLGLWQNHKRVYEHAQVTSGWCQKHKSGFCSTWMTIRFWCRKHKSGFCSTWMTISGFGAGNTKVGFAPLKWPHLGLVPETQKWVLLCLDDPTSFCCQKQNWVLFSLDDHTSLFCSTWMAPLGCGVGNTKASFAPLGWPVFGARNTKVGFAPLG